MAHNRAGEYRAGPTPQGRAAGIYGAIITASIAAAAGNSLTTPALALSVLTTLVVYRWASGTPRYSVSQAADGRLPAWRHIRVALAGNWPKTSWRVRDPRGAAEVAAQHSAI
jgi:hypothetical protein